MVSLHKDLAKYLAPFSQFNDVAPGASKNSLASKIFNRVLLESSMSILAKLIAIQPSRARSRQYLLDMTYFNWCVKNHIEYASVQILSCMLTEDQRSNNESNPVTKETLEMANCLLNLHLIF